LSSHTVINNTIIKKDRTRLLPPEKRRPVNVEEETEETAIARESDWESERDASYQAAYDEVIEAAQQEVSLILKDARHQARELVEQAEAGADKVRETAYTEGYNKGFETGVSEGAGRAENALEGLLREGQDEVDRVLAAAFAERDKLLDDMEPKILRLSLDIAQKIIQLELDQNDQAFLSLVAAALDVIKCESRVTLRINAEQHTGTFRSRAAAQIKTAQGSIEADIVTDLGIEPNGCLIENGNGTVDASVGAQLEQIGRNLGLEQYD